MRAPVLHRRPLLASAIMAAMLTTASSPPLTAQDDASAVTRLDPELDALLDPGATVEKVADGFGFVEGPVWVPGSEGRNGYLLFSDIPRNRVLRLDADDTVSVEIDPVTPSDSPAGGTGGSNGLQLDLEGHVVLCEHGNRRVARLEPDGTRTTLAERYQGKRLNSPNDVVFHSKGWAYFTDPSYGLPRGEEGRELDWNGIYRLPFDASGAPRDPELLEDGMSNPNGIGLSPDERTLYVANSSLQQRHWMAFPVLDDGALGEGRLLFDGSEISAPGVPDGFAVDEQGHLWASGPGGILILAPDGRHLGTVSVPELPANAGFGGPDGRTLYITARTGLYRIPTRVRGRSPR